MRKRNGRGDALRGLLGRNVKQFRITAGLSQEKLAEMVDISIPYLQSIERGAVWPSPATLAELAFSLDVEPSDLLASGAAVSQEIRKVVAKLGKDITALVSRSVKTLNGITPNPK
jgi:transcriptional regulator with XRE-family HTH domain